MILVQNYSTDFCMWNKSASELTHSPAGSTNSMWLYYSPQQPWSTVPLTWSGNKSTRELPGASGVLMIMSPSVWRMAIEQWRLSETLLQPLRTERSLKVYVYIV